MVDKIGRGEFLAELAHRWEPGDHLTLLGPTHRGKSTLMGQLIPMVPQFDQVAVLSPKGRDKAYAHLGRPTKVWPPKRSRAEMMGELFGFPVSKPADGERPIVWRVEPRLRTPDDFANMRANFKRCLAEVLSRANDPKGSLMIVVDDSRLLCDPKDFALGLDITRGLIIGRSKKVSIVNNFQAPRWVPREALDQCTHAIVWRNRDRDVAKRLAEIGGQDPKEFLELLIGLEYHESLWIDGKADTLFIVGAN